MESIRITIRRCMGINNPLSAIRYRLSAIGWRLSAPGFRLLAPGSWLPALGSRRAFGNPPSPLRGPLPPDKQWGAREYIGARHLPLDRGRREPWRIGTLPYHLPLMGGEGRQRHHYKICGEAATTTLGLQGRQT